LPCGLFATQVYKPGSVLTAIYLVPQLLTGSSRLPGTVGQTYCSSTALLRIEFTAPQCSHGAGGLLHRLFTLTGRSRRYLSVALVLRSPSAGVTRYPCPVEPGLSSPAAFRPAAAAVRPGCLHIVQQKDPLVKCLEKIFTAIVRATISRPFRRGRGTLRANTIRPYDTPGGANVYRAGCLTYACKFSFKGVYYNKILCFEVPLWEMPSHNILKA